MTRARCLWAAGVFANRLALLRRLRLPDRTPTSEVLEFLVERYAGDAAAQICGTLSWIVCDRQRRRLFAVRARSGEHPVYWARCGDDILVSPDPESVLAALSGSGGPDLHTLLRHLRGSPPLQGRTWHRNLSVVPPAGVLSIEAGRVRTRRYWTLQPQPLLRLPTDGDCAAALRAELNDRLTDERSERRRARGPSPGRAMRFLVLADPISAWTIERLGAQAAAHGIELLHPLSDHRMLEFAASLPVDQSFRAGVRKIIVRNAMRGQLPDTAVNRRSKIYPDAVAADALRKRAAHWNTELFHSMRLSDFGLVNEVTLRHYVEHFNAGRHCDAGFWYAASLEHWLRQYDGR